MKIITIGEKDYKLEYSFEAVEYKELVKRVFKRISGLEFTENAKDMEAVKTSEFYDGMVNALSDTPNLCRIMFYGGLLENNPVSKEEAKALMKQYMKDNKLSYIDMFNEMRDCMEDDGFFDLSGITGLMSNAAEAMENMTRKATIEQDNKKQTGEK